LLLDGVSDIFKIHHVLLSPPCTVAGIKPSKRVTMATAKGYLYIYVYVCMRELTYVHVYTHTHNCERVKTILKIFFALIFTGTGNHF